MKKNILKLIKYILMLLAIFAVLWGFLWYIAKPANSFCEQISSTDDVKAVILKAESLGYYITNTIKKNGEMRVRVQRNSFLQFTCVLDFQDNHVIKKEVLIED